MKVIFSYLDENRILKLVTYNKNLQSIIGIKLINYKILSAKYKNMETNGRIKEFFRSNDQIAYEGEYLNGKRNGKGKEYNKKGQLIYEYMKENIQMEKDMVKEKNIGTLMILY